MVFSLVSFWISVPIYYLSVFCTLLSRLVFRLIGKHASQGENSVFTSNRSIASQPLVSSGFQPPCHSTPTTTDIIKPGYAKITSCWTNETANNEDEPTSFLQFRFQTYQDFTNKSRSIYNVETLAQAVESTDNCDDEAIHNQSDQASNVYVETEVSLSDEDFFYPSAHSKVPTLSNANNDSIPKYEEQQDTLQATKLERTQNEEGGTGDDYHHANENETSQLIDLQPEEFNINKDLKSSKAAFLNLESDFAVSSDTDSDSESAVSSNLSIWSSLIDSFSDGVLSESDFVERSDLNNRENIHSAGQKEFDLSKLSQGYETCQLSDKEEDDEDIMAELKGIEEQVKKEDLKSHYTEGNNKQTKTKDVGEDQRFEHKFDSKNKKLEYDNDDHNEMETEWEHQELIEQLKMEMKKAKATGLPTIFEETESLKITEDLKPWKIEEKFARIGTMDEIHKFYKSYRERMRKLDIFNYQKMYAIGFIRLKDPLQSSSTHNSSIPTIISQDCWPCNQKPSSSKYPMLKFRRDLERDLELVYVGQLCLSWEFLHWQYEKASSLWDSDPHSIRSYSEVAGEFQQFQVLLQRLMEDESFQGPRVQNYVKNRCAYRQILQVPLIREDKAKERTGNGKDSVASLMLVEIVEESIRLLWRFIRTDKDAKVRGTLSCRKAAHVELQNQEDANLLMELKESLRKKDKKLRGAMRGECCILKRLLGDEQAGLDEVSCFFSRVDLRLVSRVLNMSRITTEQLSWCSSKLNTIQIVDNKVHIEPSSLLFPC